MVEHTILVSVEDAVSMSWKRADGLAELCRGMIDSGSDEANSWASSKTHSLRSRPTSSRQRGRLTSCTRSLGRAPIRAMGLSARQGRGEKPRAKADKAESALLKGPTYAAFAGVLFRGKRPPTPVTDWPSRRKASWRLAMVTQMGWYALGRGLALCA